MTAADLEAAYLDAYDRFPDLREATRAELVLEVARRRIVYIAYTVPVAGDEGNGHLLGMHEQPQAKPDKKTTLMAVPVDEELLKAATAHAKAKGVSRAEFVREAMRAALSKKRN